MLDERHCVEWRGDHFRGRFSAMASPCELLMDCQDQQLAHQLLDAAIRETRRIEQKYSRYLAHNLMARINSSQGRPVSIDAETYKLLQFANTCHALSDGLFDITSGVLRRAWRFDGSDRLPTDAQIQALLPLIGWHRVRFDEHSICLPDGFELDFGGIGKEYAVDRVATLALQMAPDCSVLVNFGGDIQVTRPRSEQQHWQIGIEDPHRDDHALTLIQIRHGGLATSGDARRYLLKDGIRYGHILNPKTGYPISGAPRSVTVAAAHCIEAGMLATLSLLQGASARDFLDAQGVPYWLCE